MSKNTRQNEVNAAIEKLFCASLVNSINQCFWNSLQVWLHICECCINQAAWSPSWMLSYFIVESNPTLWSYNV